MKLIPCILLSLSTAAQAALIGYWPLDTITSNTTPNVVTPVIGSTLAPNGTVINNNTDISIVTDPYRGSVLSSIGTNGTYVALADLPAITPTSSFTWSFFVRSNQVPSNDVFLGNRSNADGVGGDSQWLKFTASQFEWKHSSVGTIGSAYASTIQNTSNITGNNPAENPWQHLALVKNGLTLYVYQNGNLVRTTTLTEATASFAAGMKLQLAGDRDFPAEAAAGRFDDVAVWDHALSAADIMALATGAATPLTVPEPGRALLLCGALLGVLLRRRR